MYELKKNKNNKNTTLLEQFKIQLKNRTNRGKTDTVNPHVHDHSFLG